MSPRAMFATMGVLCLVSAPYRLAAQNGPLVARAASVTGPASVVISTGAAFALSPGFELNPGDRVDTRGGGRVVIDLSDGSMVVVEPQSVVQLKDFRQAESLRELFEITLGKVRVKINHFAGRPNPYRMNSPTASIAVRGTEFSIEVAPGGDTQVTVYEGAVQVTSLSDPNRSVLVEAGRGVLVRGGQDFRLQNIGAGPFAGRTDPDADRHTHAGNDPPAAGPGPGNPSPSASPQQRADFEAATQRATAASTYDNYVASLSDLGQMPFLFRFNAFPEAHLDSLENPAYATQFTSPEVRIFLLPALGGGPELDDNTFGPSGARSSDFSGTPQISLFSPLGHSGFVAGGAVSYTGASNSSLNVTPDEDMLASGQNPGFNHVSGTSLSNYYTGSLVLARRLGSAGSFGFEMESLRGSGSLTATRTDTDFTTPSLERIFSTSLIRQNRLTAGFSRDFTPRTRIGVFYRYGFISATDHDLSHTVNATPLGLNSTVSSGHSSEFGLRLRGVLTPRLFYGLAGSWVNVALGDSLVRTSVVNSHERDRDQRGTLGFGIGYALTPRAVLTLDVDAGTSRVAASRLEDATGNTLQNGTANSHFASTHLAIQFDLTRRLFWTTSYMHIWHAQQLSVNLFPDQSAATSLVQDSFFPVTPTAYQLATHFSDFGIGWRFSPNLFVQYLFTTDYDVSAPSHVLMLRYTIKFRKD
ncbi:MAG TPA: FecR domain-containing protein [Bryobacteraceae bacterium]